MNAALQFPKELKLHDNLCESHNCKLFQPDEGPNSSGLHPRPTQAHETSIRDFTLESFHDICGVSITRWLPCNQKYFGQADTAFRKLVRAMIGRSSLELPAEIPDDRRSKYQKRD